MKNPHLTFTPHHDPSIKIEKWLQYLFSKYPETQNTLLRRAVTLAQLTGNDHVTASAHTGLQQGIYIADILMGLSVDQETLAAAILYQCTRNTDLRIEDIAEQINLAVAKLISGVKKMDALQTLSEQTGRVVSQNNIDNIRKMLLAMVDDVRIVLIKLAERLAILRHLVRLSDTEKRREAKITQDIYAPLANRLGIGQLKWELEDLSFRYLNPETYSSIRTALNSTRVERENYVKDLIHTLEKEALDLNITQVKVEGRAKHIYSIYRKMTRKNVNFSEIYDVLAFRILVPTIEDCYRVLGHVHSLWAPIPKEFDDYVSKPKPNGYRSIHTAVIGPHGRTMEIQIRTFGMHAEAELGVAAHWIYKEGKPIKTGYEAKIAWLRQIMDWQLEVTQTDKPAQQAYAHVFDEHIYVFTPQGDVIELIKDATPLDFAYYIHTSLGHRCRGARVNGQMVPLTHPLKTGECVEILTAKKEHPSRDWLISSLGYLKTSRAKSKVLHWLREQHAGEHKEQGETILEKELRRLKLKDIDYEKLAQKMHFPSTEHLFISIGRGDTTLTTVINTIQSISEAPPETKTPTLLPLGPSQISGGSDIQVLGVGNLLTHIAMCCKPVPYDPILGYVTQGQGISIHRADCINILHMSDGGAQQKERLIQVTWGEKIEQHYTVNLAVDAYDRPGLIRDVTQVVLSENISILGLNCVTNKNNHTAHIQLSIEVQNLHFLSRILTRIMQLPNVADARRV